MKNITCLLSGHALHSPSILWCLFVELTQGELVMSNFVTLHSQVVFNPETGRSKGFGFVKFDDARDAEDAIKQADGQVKPCYIPLLASTVV